MQQYMKLKMHYFGISVKPWKIFILLLYLEMWNSANHTRVYIRVNTRVNVNANTRVNMRVYATIRDIKKCIISGLL